MAKPKRKYNHGEAFRLMKYVDSEGTIEWIWNSRDGVTPFVVMSLAGLESMHTDWGNDPYLPNHIPKIGDRVFVDITEESARPRAIEFVEKFWSDPKYPMSEAYESKEAAVQMYVDTWTKDKGAPDVIVVGQAFLDKLAEETKENQNEN